MENRDIYEYGWGLKGQRIYGQRPGKKRERISIMSGYHLGKLVAPFTWIGIAKHTKVGMIWVAGRSPTLVSQNLKATTLTYLAIYQFAPSGFHNLPNQLATMKTCII